MKAVYKRTITVTDKNLQRDAGGIEPKVMGETEEGKKAMIKSPSPNHAIAERLCYLLAKKLGLKVNKVQLITYGHKLNLPSELCSVHYWEEDFRPCAEYSPSRTGNSKVDRKRREERVALEIFDILIGNGDRHEMNYGYVNDELFLIDHGHCTPWYGYGNNLKYEEEPLRLENRHPVAKLVAKFLELTREDFVEMVQEIPTNYFDPDLALEFIRAMMKKQDAIRSLKEKGPTHQCSCCGTIREATTEHFYADRSKKYGLSNWCKSCTDNDPKRR